MVLGAKTSTTFKGGNCSYVDTIPGWQLQLCWHHSRVATAVMLTPFQGGNCSYVDTIPRWQLQLCWQYSRVATAVMLTIFHDRQYSCTDTDSRQHSKTTDATTLLGIHSRLIIFHTKSHRYVIHHRQPKNSQFLHHLEEREYGMRSVCAIRDTVGSGEICWRHSHLHCEGRGWWHMPVNTGVVDIPSAPHLAKSSGI